MAEELKITVKHPYEGVNWETINQYNFAHHVHARGQTYENPYQLEIDRYLGGADKYHALQMDDREAGKTPVWPWQDYDRFPEELGMYNIPGSEISVGGNHFVFLWSFYVRNPEEEGHAAIQASEDDAFVYLAHPVEGKNRDLGHYREPIPFDWVEEYFKKHEKIKGLAVLNDYRAAYNNEDFELWHELLLHFGSERPVYAYSEADCSAGRGGCFDHRYDRVLAEEIPDVHPDTDYSSPGHESSFKDAWGNGQTFWINNQGPGIPPYVREVMIDDGVISLEIEGSYDEIKWMYGTEKIGTGKTFVVADNLESAPDYVRFEVWQGHTTDASYANIVGSQAFYIETEYPLESAVLRYPDNEFGFMELPVTLEWEILDNAWSCHLQISGEE